MIGVVYLGNNPKTEIRLKYIPARKVRLAKDYKEAAEACSQQATGEHFIVFIEKGNIEEDVAAVTYLRKNLNNIYVVLLTERMEKGETETYLKCGVNDTLDVNATVTEMNKKIQFISDLENVFFDEQPAQRKILQFRIPMWKRVFDVIFALLSIIILSPVLVVTAIAIKMDSEGPIMFKSKRVGTNYRIFDFLKFRSMYVDAEKRLKELSKTDNQYAGKASDAKGGTASADEEPQPELQADGIDNDLMMIGDDQVMLVGDDFVVSEDDFSKQKEEDIRNAFVKIENDPRVTRVGRFIRKYSIDELPQLFNILKGEMSIVGNRPLPLYEAEKLTTDNDIDRFMAPAGLTGLWQVEERGKAGNMSAEERKQLDIKYGQTYNFLLDLKIILKTFTAFIQKEDV